MARIALLALVLSLLALPPLPRAQACQLTGPNTHMGVVTAVDAAQKTLTLKDAETGDELTFVAARPELLRGIAPKDRVTVVFTPQGQTLRATSIKKG